MSAPSPGRPARSAQVERVFVALLLAQALAALDMTVVSTALPTIVSELGGFRSFSWVFSAYLLTYTATIPIYGRLADLYGRKSVLSAAIALFLLGSLLSGLAHSMTQLILFRGLQGLGAGGVQPIAMTVVGDLFRLEERARRQGYISSVWAVSSVFGPMVGGLLVLVTWRLIFFLNLPIGIVGLLLLQEYRDEAPQRRDTALDVPGSLFLLLWVSALIFGLVEGSAIGLTTARALFAFAVALAGFAAFLLWERRVREPIFPFHLLRMPVISVGDAASFTAGGLMVGLSGFIPTFVQGVDRLSPTVAGLVLTTMSIGWPLASVLTGRLIPRLGPRLIGILGGVLAVLGTAFLVLIGPGSPVWHIAVLSFLIGAGLGFVTTTAIIFIQEAVPWQKRGVATGSNMFSRQLGSTIFVSVMGAVLNSGMAARLTGGEAILNALLYPGIASVPAALAQRARLALAASLHEVFLTALGLAVLTLLLELVFPDVGRPAVAKRLEAEEASSD